MLRLPATVIPLTRGEIAQYESRNERRRDALSGRIPQERKPPMQLGRNTQSAFLNLHKGPQRAVSYGRSPSPTSMSSTDDTFPSRKSSSFESNVEISYASMRGGGDTRLLSAELKCDHSRRRRDSTLSYEETTSRKQYDGHYSEKSQSGSASPLYKPGTDLSEGLLSLTLASEVYVSLATSCNRN